MDRKDLKIQALLEKVSNMVTNYENQIADLRVDVTMLSNELETVKQELQGYREDTNKNATDDTD